MTATPAMGAPPVGEHGQLRAIPCLHDVGKISVPEEILAEPTILTPTEFELVKGHAQQSHEILKGVEFPWPVAQVAKYSMFTVADRIEASATSPIVYVQPRRREGIGLLNAMLVLWPGAAHA